MKSLHLVVLTAAVATGALSLAGCARTADPTQRTALDCPPIQGELTRAGISADRRSCTYTSAKGDEIALRLLPVSTTPDAALQPVEQELQALVPATGPAQAAAKPAAEAATPKTATSKPAGANDAADSDDDDTADDTHEDRANISFPGVRIDAQGDKADVRIGSLHVDASSGGAVIRETHDVRLRGQALAFTRRGYRAVYIVARSDLPDGLTSVGYEAGGPRKGPLTVAVIRMKSHGDDVYKDVRHLVRRNAGI